MRGRDGREGETERERERERERYGREGNTSLASEVKTSAMGGEDAFGVAIGFVPHDGPCMLCETQESTEREDSRLWQHRADRLEPSAGVWGNPEPENAHRKKPTRQHVLWIRWLPAALFPSTTAIQGDVARVRAQASRFGAHQSQDHHTDAAQSLAHQRRDKLHKRTMFLRYHQRERAPELERQGQRCLTMDE
eukprot:639418-Rhodomonas_salina.2